MEEDKIFYKFYVLSVIIWWIAIILMMIFTRCTVIQSRHIMKLQPEGIVVGINEKYEEVYVCFGCDSSGNFVKGSRTLIYDLSGFQSVKVGDYITLQ
jgi:hypothetical protein